MTLEELRTERDRLKVLVSGAEREIESLKAATGRAVAFPVCLLALALLAYLLWRHK